MVAIEAFRTATLGGHVERCEDCGEVRVAGRRVCLLFEEAAETIRVIGPHPEHLGAETGMIAVLHTWGQALI